jgi:hypothetical protein
MERLDKQNNTLVTQDDTDPNFDRKLDLITEGAHPFVRAPID